MQLVLALTLVLLSPSAFGQTELSIVTVREGADPLIVAREHGLSPQFVYRAALNGFAARLPNERTKSELRLDRRVELMEADQDYELPDLRPIFSRDESMSWGLDRVDQRSLPLNGRYQATTTGAGVNAYIIDSGIRFDHAELEGRAVFGFDALGGNGRDCNGHGTHVAGTVGGVTHGVAKKVKLISVRIFGCNGSTTTASVIAGIDWVAANRVRPAVANLSFGGPASATMDAAVRRMIVTYGVSAAIAAGNESRASCLHSPASVSEAMTVAASDSMDRRAGFSNYGSCVDWFAPGVDIRSAWIDSRTAVAELNGTSMAAPHVAGVAALYLQRHRSASPATVRSALYRFSTKRVIADPNTANRHLLYSLERAQ